MSAKQTSLEYAVSVTSRVNGLGHINTDRNTQRKLIDFQVMFQDIDPGRVGCILCPCRCGMNRIDGPASSAGSGSEPSEKTGDGTLIVIYDVQKQNTGG
ncbi:unnamed protein product [Leuciscus chuanchicus]